MAYTQTIRSLLLAALTFAVPSIASAQRVHEVRPAPSGEVRIGVDANGSMDELVALARRISGDESLTADDVLANNEHVRYVCHARGHQTFSRTADGCADATRDGLVRGTFYRVPRTHGTTLAPRATVPRTVPATAPVADAQAGERIAALEAQVTQLTHELEDAASRAFDAESAADNAASELDALRHAPPPEPQVHMEFLQDPAQAAEIERLREENARLAALPHDSGLPWWIGFLLGLAALLMFYGFFYRERTLRPFRDEIARLGDELKDERLALRASDQDKFTAEEEIALLRPKLALYERGRRIWRIWHDVAQVQFENLKKDLTQSFKKKRDEDHAAEKQARDERAQRNRRIGELRDMHERVEVYRLQIAEATDYMAKALSEDDEIAVRNCQAVIAQCETDLKAIQYDPAEVKRELDELVAVQAIALTELCGFEFDGSSTDPWRSDMETRTRRKQMEADTKRAMFTELCKLVKKDQHALAADHNDWLRTKRAELEAEYAAKEGSLMGKLWLQAAHASDAHGEARQAQIQAKDLEASLAEARLREQALLGGEGSDQATASLITMYDARIADLQQQARTANAGRVSDPGIPSIPPEEEPLSESGSSARPVRARRDTGSLERAGLEPTLQVHIPISPAPRLEGALLGELFDFLEHFTRLGNGSAIHDKVLICNELEGRDLLFFISNFSLRCPALHGKDIPLRRMAITLEKAGKGGLMKSRLRRRTDPPGAPSLG